METIHRFFQMPRQSFFLFGPRGTGKSTWLKQQCPNAIYIDLLSPEAYRLFSARPERRSWPYAFDHHWSVFLCYNSVINSVHKGIQNAYH